MAIVLVASSCSGEDGADGGVAGGSPAAPAATASAASSASGDEAAAIPVPVEGSESAGEAGSSGGAAEQTMRLADEEHALEAASCNLPDQADGPFRINAETADGRGSLLVVGVGGLGSATIE